MLASSYGLKAPKRDSTALAKKQRTLRLTELRNAHAVLARCCGLNLPMRWFAALAETTNNLKDPRTQIGDNFSLRPSFLDFHSSCPSWRSFLGMLSGNPVWLSSLAQLSWRSFWEPLAEKLRKNCAFRDPN